MTKLALAGSGGAFSRFDSGLVKKRVTASMGVPGDEKGDLFWRSAQRFHRLPPL